jgi:hypothetical protein
MNAHRLIRSAALGLTVALLAAPAAGAVPADLRGPDARDAAKAAAVQQDRPRQDLRTPDARDQAAGRGTFNAPEVTVVKVAEPAPAATGGGLDWADAGLGAGGMLGLVLVAIASVVMVVHHRKSVGHGGPAASA